MIRLALSVSNLGRFLIGLLLVVGQAHALQVLDGEDGSTVIAKISKKEITRVFVEQGRISSLRVKEGELTIAPDDETGQIFVSLPDGATKPVNGFLTTEDGRTFNIIFQPLDGPGDSIAIKQRRGKTKVVESDFKSTTFDKMVIRLMTVMANDQIPDDLELKEVGQSLSLWKEANMTLDRRYLGDSLVGEIYTVGNVSGAMMVLDEREFFRRGVVSVAVDQTNVPPGGSTRVYVVREKQVNE